MCFFLIYFRRVLAFHPAPATVMDAFRGLGEALAGSVSEVFWELMGTCPEGNYRGTYQIFGTLCKPTKRYITLRGKL